MSIQFHVYIEDGKLKCLQAAVKADIGFRAICSELQFDGGVVCRETCVRGRSQRDADGIADGVISRKGIVPVTYENSITNYQVAFIRNGVHVPNGKAIVVCMVQMVCFTDYTVVPHLTTGVIFGNVLPFSGCIVHARVDTVDTAD